MTYRDDELAGLDPVEFFEFIFGDAVWRFTDSDAIYVDPTTGYSYAPELISRSSLAQNDEDNSMSMEVTVDALNPVAEFFRTPFLPVSQIWLTVYRGHIGSVNVATLFKGKVGQCEFSGKVAKLTCVPIRVATTKLIPIQLVQQLCTNTLYDNRCLADPDLFKEAGTITAINGLTFTVTGSFFNPGGYYDGGFMQKDGLPAATILAHEASLNTATIKLLYNPGYKVGDVVTLYAGCDKRYPTCQTKFDNTQHYQGFANFPTQDPFANDVL